MGVNDIRVIEFGTYLSASLVGRYMADAGFDVTSIMKPLNTKKHCDEYGYMKPMIYHLHKGKRRLLIDLKTNVEEAKALIKDCHVLVENFKPGCMQALGLGVEDCARLNPDLIYVSIPGYASDDERFVNVKAWDSIIMASSGVFSDMGLNRTLLGVECSFSGLKMPSIYASLYASSAIVSALFDSSLGRRIEVPLASCITEALVHNSIEFPLHDSYKNLRQLRIQEQRFPINLQELEALIDPFFSKYKCLDNRPIYVVCPSHTRHQKDLLDCLGILDQVSRIIPQKINPYNSENPYHGFGSGRLTQDEANMVRSLMQHAIASKTSYEWERILGKRNVPCIAHKSMDEWMATSHARDSGLVDENGGIGPVQWHRVVKSAQVPCEKRFKDLKIIDLTNVIAGPTIGAMLARLGANVTKIDPVNPFYGPTVTIVYGVVVNIGKKSLLLDISTPAGRGLLNEMIKESDAIVVNNTLDALKRIGLTHAELVELNPDIILMQFDAWSGHLESGEYANFVGYDDNVQAGIGIMERFGGDLDHVEEHAHIGTIDVIAGVAGSFALIVALLRRKLDMIITTARTSLAAVGQYLQYDFIFQRYEHIGKGTECKGFNPLYRYYKTRDAYIMTVVGMIRNKNRLDRLTDTIFGSEDCEVALGAMTSEDAIKHLRSFDCEAVKIQSLVQLKKEFTSARLDRQKTYQFLEQCNHPIGRLVIVPPIAIRFDKHTYSLGFSPKYGAQTFEILDKYTKTHLLITGDASTAYSRNYLPYTERCGKCNRAHAVIQLYCSHKFCHLCMCAADRQCYVCGRPHEMDVARIRQSVFEWTNAYNRWRRGEPSGSRDIHRVLAGDRTVTKSQSQPCLKTVAQSTSLTSNGSFCAGQTDKSGTKA